MKKILSIAWKDLLITLSDPAALILTIATPFALTLVMIFAFGDANNGGGIRGIPVVIVNQDESGLGKTLIDVFESENLVDLIAPVQMADIAEAKSAVDKDDFAAAIIIPEGFGEGIIPSNMEPTTEREQAVIEIYGNPTRPTSVSITKSIVDEFIYRTSAMVMGAEVSITQLITSGRLDLMVSTEEMMNLGEFAARQISEQQIITLQGSMAEGSVDTDFDWFGYIAPSMALLFLMFTVSNGGRSILAEKDGGTIVTRPGTIT